MDNNVKKFYIYVAFMNGKWGEWNNSVNLKLTEKELIFNCEEKDIHIMLNNVVFYSLKIIEENT